MTALEPYEARAMPMSAPAVVCVVDTWTGVAGVRVGECRQGWRGAAGPRRTLRARAGADAHEQSAQASHLQLQGAGKDVPKGGGDHHAQHAVCGEGGGTRRDTSRGCGCGRRGRALKCAPCLQAACKHSPSVLGTRPLTHEDFGAVLEGVDIGHARLHGVCAQLAGNLRGQYVVLLRSVKAGR